MPRTQRGRKRRRKSKFRPKGSSFAPVHYAATRIQRVWRGSSDARVCAFGKTYVPREDRIVVDGYAFSRVTLRTYIQRTGDSRHIVTREPLAHQTLLDIGLSPRVVARRRRIYLRQLEEIQSMHSIVFDEFKETLHAKTFNFGPFILCVERYRSVGASHADFETLYDEIHNYCDTRHSPGANLHDRIIRTILLEREPTYDARF